MAVSYPVPQLAPPDRELPPHQAMIDALVASDQRITANGFNAAMRKVLEWRYDKTFCEEEGWNRVKLIPDAYYIDAPNLLIVCYEVENTAPVNPKRMAKYAYLWQILDGYEEWEWIVVAYDTLGNPRVIDAVDAYYRNLPKPMEQIA